ncbi:CHASE4 domain-containing protein [Roseimaritima ulvae]|uniref:histidine kinase n=1 Tax=Roseimaritima ulvae TaxID=980254 RepID=A0A5B9R7C3_9BACT|nr:CHASE4 domain-containing protein [Roseimaritima ulvae]QEG42323.1 Sensor protein SrrB [Roseimaritima ulvae]
MNLRLKILLSLIAVLVLYVISDAAIQQFVVFPRFLELEQAEAARNLQRCHQAIERDLEHLDYFVHDWSARDDLHAYVSGRNESFPAEHFKESTFTDADLNLLAVLDVDDKVVYQGIRDSQSKAPITLPRFPQDRWEVTHPLLQHDKSFQPLAEQTVRGLMMTERGPMAVVSRPILRSSNLPPANGTLVMGRFLDQRAIDAISEQTAVSFSMTPVSQVTPTQQAGFPDSLRNFLVHGGRQRPLAYHAIDDRRLKVQSGLTDISGHPIVLTAATIDRNVSRQGRAAMRYAIGSLLLSAFVVLTILLLLLQRIVITPLIQLSDHASSIGETGDLSVRANLQRRDEFGNLARHFDAMVNNLSESQNRLIELSRKAGMSDMAAGVLHNVGNVITNVNVLSSAMAHQLGESKLTGMKKSADMLRAHATELDRFLTADPRGKQLPLYICQVTDHLEREQDDLRHQLKALDTNLQHVSQILEAQQKLATGAAVLQSVKVDQLLDDAIGMQQASLDRCGVRLRRIGQASPTIRIDRGKVIQVLVNLLGNAKDAVRDQPANRREIQVVVSLPQQDSVTIEVRDSGCGIAAEHLEKIFAGGFTTKSDGHGQGLHFCALAVTEMKGSLSVKSEGPGQGATFSLTLPYQLNTEAVQS